MGGKDIKFTVTLTNVGKYDQYEVPQVYISHVDSSVEWPYKELKAFDKVLVKAGESVPVTLTIPFESLKYWNEEKHDWVMDLGKMEALLARDAGNIVSKIEVNLQ